MGTYSDFRIGKFSLESSGNFNTTTHHSIYVPSNSTFIEKDWGDGPRTVEVFQATLREILPRLELLGSTLSKIERRFSNPYITYDEPHDVPFDEALMLVRNADLHSLPDFEGSEDNLGIFPDPYQQRLLDTTFQQSYVGLPGWDLSALLDRLSPYDALRVLAERPENLDLPVTWDFMDVVDSGYFERKDFTVGADGQGYLLVTEGTSDTDIIRHAFGILRPQIADFFRYVDMERNHPFGGHGNLLNFMKGLDSIGMTGGVLAIFDNDAAGVGSLKELARHPNVRAVKLPDLEEFRSFPTIGPSGEHLADINGRAAAIECYLALPEGCRIRWNNFDHKAGEYQGAIDQRDSEKSRHRDVFLMTSASDDYPFDKIAKVLDMIVEACIRE